MRNPAVLLVCFVVAFGGLTTATWAAKPEPVAKIDNPMVEAGKSIKVYDPNVGEDEDKDWYINDHCVIFGPDNRWHLYGINHFIKIKPKRGRIRPTEERQFAHASAASLLQQPWDKHEPSLTAKPGAPWHERHIWAPHAIEHDGTYYMYYCAGSKDNTKYKIHLATSPDCKTWTRHPNNPMLVDGFDARDPFVMKHGDKWIMYYTATTEPEFGNHAVVYMTSDDLIHWKDRGIAFIDPAKGKWGGPCESPQVIRRGDLYYLMLGPRNGNRIEYIGTDVYVSRDPLNWKIEDRVGHIRAHAPEVVRDLDGKWYITDCGWGRRGVFIAPLIWKDGQTDPETNIEVPKAR